MERLSNFTVVFMREESRGSKVNEEWVEVMSLLFSFVKLYSAGMISCDVFSASAFNQQLFSYFLDWLV